MSKKLIPWNFEPLEKNHEAIIKWAENEIKEYQNLIKIIKKKLRK